jgi:GT2 family glycosyltransferase
MAAPLVKIIIVCWNRRELTLKLLSSLSNLTYPSREILVVDNASTDGSAGAVRENFPEAAVLVNNENLGASGGFNAGMKAALKEGRCSHVWLLDSDLLAENDSLEKLVRAMEENPGAGMAGPAVLNLDYPELVMETGAVVDWKTANTVGLKKGEIYREEEGTIEADYLPGGCGTLISSEALRKTGLMDDGLYFLWEDIDLGLRFKKAGYRVLAVPSARVFHRDITLVRGSPRHRYYSTRNSLVFYFRHSPERACRVKSLERAVTTAALFNIWGFGDYSRAASQGLRDFMRGVLGKKEYDFKRERKFTHVDLKEMDPGKLRNLVIFPEAESEVSAFLSSLPPDPKRKVFVAVESFKKNQFLKSGTENLIFFESFSARSMLENHARIKALGPCLIVCTKEVFSPLLGLCGSLTDILMARGTETFLKKKDPLAIVKYALAGIYARLAGIFLYWKYGSGGKSEGKPPSGTTSP